ncbi:MAG TPA: periplasmic heavy metal sensor, partial [Pseudomonadales bacterium]|nr:periplasmic heavy metal sensor [Pseudomonadales bacterium]
MRTNRWLIGGLVLSVILNLLLVGFMIGRMSGFGPPPGFGPDPTAGFFRLLGFLPDDRRAAIAPDLRKQMGDLLPVLRKMRGDQHRVFETLTAEPFD